MIKVSWKKRWKQFWCQHADYGRTGYPDLNWEYLPAGWIVEDSQRETPKYYFWSPNVCSTCGYVDIPEEVYASTN